MSNVLFKVGTLNAYEHVPQVSGKLPVIVFLPGKGEVGTDASKLLINGPSKFIQDGWAPQNAIYVSVQPTAEWANPAYVDTIVNNIKSRYSAVSDGRLLLTGLSAGAYAIDNYIGQSAENSAKVTAVVSFSAPEPETYFNPAFFTQPAWGFCGNNDSWYDKMKKLFTVTTSKKFTTMGGYGHNGWNNFYNPLWKENGVSVYDFLIAQGSGSVTPPVQPPDVPVVTPPVPNAVYPVAVLMSDGTQRAVSHL